TVTPPTALYTLSLHDALPISISISSKHYHRVFLALLVSNSVSLFLFGLRAFGTQSDRYWFLLWNLFLAWLPLVFAWALSRNLLTDRKSTRLNSSHVKISYAVF